MKELDDKKMELLCDSILFGLTEEELRELEGIDRSAMSSLDAQELELTAAKLSLIGIDKDEQLPQHLFDKIAADAIKHISSDENVFTRPRREAVVETAPSGSIWGWLGWAAAATACIALAVNLYTTRSTTEVVTGPQPTPTVEAPLTPAALRAQLLASGEATLVKAEWGKGNVPASENISGDVVWSDDKQVGYMRLRGLPVNDKTREQYQLWIFEDGKLEPHPKDGGVFDVNAEGEVIIPIDAKLATNQPKAFAITIEKPGGVVVSDRKRIAGLAVVKPSA